jgi:3-oxoacyl-(acyl-carrier-protein) synthase
MMEQGFVAPSANIEELDPEAGNFPLVRETEAATLHCVM